MFGVDERTGLVTTRSELSRDLAAKVSFTVEVRDVRAVNPPPVQQTATGTLYALFRATAYFCHLSKGLKGGGCK